MFNPLNMINRMIDDQGQRVVNTFLKLSEKLPTILRQMIPDEDGVTIDDTFVNRFVLTLYSVVVAIPHPVLQASGYLNAVYSIMIQKPDQTTVEFLCNRLRQGFASVSPSYATGITDQMLIEVGKVALVDWLRFGGQLPPEGQVKMDMHFYSMIIFEMRGHKVDQRTVMLEAIHTMETMSGEERAVVEPMLAEFKQLLEQLGGNSEIH